MGYERLFSDFAWISCRIRRTAILKIPKMGNRMRLLQQLPYRPNANADDLAVKCSAVCMVWPSGRRGQPKGAALRDPTLVDFGPIGH